jgi:CrcB protein
VNIIGSFLLGVLFSAIEHGIIGDQYWRPFIGIGLLGALTTFSTFSMDSLMMLQQGEWNKAILNILLNVFVCLVAAWLGLQSFSAKA